MKVLHHAVDEPTTNWEQRGMQKRCRYTYVRYALILGTTGVEVIVVADDTDVTILFLYHWNVTMPGITITFEKT